jgi:hypothetical protein
MIHTRNCGEPGMARGGVACHRPAHSFSLATALLRTNGRWRTVSCRQAPREDAQQMREQRRQRLASSTLARRTAVLHDLRPRDWPHARSRSSAVLINLAPGIGRRYICTAPRPTSREALDAIKAGVVLGHPGCRMRNIAIQCAVAPAASAVRTASRGCRRDAPGRARPGSGHCETRRKFPADGQITTLGSRLPPDSAKRHHGGSWALGGNVICGCVACPNPRSIRCLMRHANAQTRREGAEQTLPTLLRRSAHV